MLKSYFKLTFREDDAESYLESKDNIVFEIDKEVCRCLNKSEIGLHLSFLGKTANGDGYAYLKADLSGMNLTSLQAIKCFKQLQFVDVSNNNLDLDELQTVTELPYLVLLQADKNRLKSAALHKTPYLQVLIMNNNDLTTVYDVFQPQLSTLEVGFNKIRNIDFGNPMPEMKCLDFRNNEICDIKNLDFPKLDSLYLASNNITSLVGLEQLVNLRILHVRDNPIKVLAGFSERHKKLSYINLRDCEVASLKQLKKLKVLTDLQILILRGCPYMGDQENSDSPDYKDNPETCIEILALLPKLKRINKDIVSSDERTDAKNVVLEDVEGQNDSSGSED